MSFAVGLSRCSTPLSLKGRCFDDVNDDRDGGSMITLSAEAAFWGVADELFDWIDDKILNEMLVTSEAFWSKDKDSDDGLFLLGS